MIKERCFKYVVRTGANIPKEVKAIETKSSKKYFKMRNDAEHKGFVF